MKRTLLLLGGAVALVGGLVWWLRSRSGSAGASSSATSIAFGNLTNGATVSPSIVTPGASTPAP